MEETIKRILLENQEMISSKEIMKRNIYFPQTDNINILTGIRRSGKTYMLYDIAGNYSKDQILFIDFEDERCITLNSLPDYDCIIDSYKRLFPEEQPVLFFDEIQSLRNWHLYVKRLFAQGYKIYITGSNANLLSKEIATYLAGRSIETRVFTFSFSEFLRFKNINIQPGDIYVAKNKLLNLLDEYMLYGGFPEVIKTPVKDKKIVMKNIYNLLFYKDLITKYDKNEYLLKLIVSKLAENITKSFSLSSLTNKIIPFFKTTKPTVIDYISILSGPFLVESIFQYRKSYISRQMERKIYFTDNLFITINSIESDKGKLLENLVFNELSRSQKEIYYYKSGNFHEVDFLLKDNQAIELFQVAYSIADYDTRKREIKALLKAMKELNINKSIILTYNEEEKIAQNGFEIQVIPVWKWLVIEDKDQETRVK